MHTRGSRVRLVAAAVLLVTATLVLTATGASGLPQDRVSPIPESAFRPVSVPPPPAAIVVPERTPDLRPFAEAAPSTAPAERPQPGVPEARAIVVAVPTPTPKPPPRTNTDRSSGSTTTQRTGNSISGLASWYCRAGVSICTTGYPDGPGVDAYAAAGPRLRAAIGPGWRGNIVYVDGIRVKLVDWCQCYKGEPNEKLLDLYYDVYARTGTRVVVSW